MCCVSFFTADYLKPMSDAFISHLVQKTGVIFDLASELDVSKPELEDIKINPLVKTAESKMIGVRLVLYSQLEEKKKGSVLFNNALNTFYFSFTLSDI